MHIVYIIYIYIHSVYTHYDASLQKGSHLPSRLGYRIPYHLGVASHLNNIVAEAYPTACQSFVNQNSTKPNASSNDNY